MQDGSYDGIYAQRYNANGEKVGVETQINTYIDNKQLYSNVISLKDGGYLISWTSYNQDGSGTGIYAQRYDKDGNKWAEEEIISVKENESIIIDVLSNDSDADGDNLVINRVSEVKLNGEVVGTTQIVNIDGKQQIKFTPNDKLDYLKEGESKEINFEYTITDGKGGYSSATVNLNVEGVDENSLLSSGDFDNIVQQMNAYGTSSIDISIDEENKNSINQFIPIVQNNI